MKMTGSRFSEKPTRAKNKGEKTPNKQLQDFRKKSTKQVIMNLAGTRKPNCKLVGKVKKHPYS